MLTNVKLLAAVGILILILVAGGYIYYLNTRIEHLNLLLQIEKEKNQGLEAIIRDLTEIKKDAQERATDAEKKRKQVAAELQAALQKMRGQRPPTNCDEAVKWSVERKDDLKW